MKRLLWAALGAVVILAAVLVARAATTSSLQPAVQPAAAIPVDAGATARRLAGALRFRTISYQDSSQFDAAEFRGLHAYLTQTFPGSHAALHRETVAGSSLLYQWTGSDTTLAPLVLMAHMDVVPVEPGTESKWTHPAFDGVIAEGYVWGRGALDDKVNVMAELEAVEALVAQGARPRRTVYLAFGHDEEVGGRHGARVIMETLRARGVRPALVVDEGGAVVQGMIPGVAGPVALTGIAEKGFVSLELTVKAAGGHSSSPPRQTAIGILAAAIDELEEHPVPGGLRGPVATMFDYLAGEMPFGMRIVMANRWLFGGVVARRFGAAPAGAAMLHTTTAPTIFHAGVKENVLPSTAQAVVNYRLAPGDSIRTITEFTRRTINDPRVEIRVMEGTRSEPSPVSPVDSKEFRLLARTIREVIPDAIVAPWLLIGGTDSRYYAALTPNVYRFSGVALQPDDIERAHGTNERVALDAYAQNIRFYIQLLRNAAINIEAR